MNKTKIAAVGTGALVLVAVAFVLITLVVKALWAWTIPDLFPGAVEQGLVAESISWGTAMKVAIFAAILTGLGQGHHRSTVVSSGGRPQPA